MTSLNTLSEITCINNDDISCLQTSSEVSPNKLNLNIIVQYWILGLKSASSMHLPKNSLNIYMYLTHRPFFVFFFFQCCIILNILYFCFVFFCIYFVFLWLVRCARRRNATIFSPLMGLLFSPIRTHLKFLLSKIGKLFKCCWLLAVVTRCIFCLFNRV